MSQIRQNYHEECEAAINKQINLEQTASYIYTAMGHHFSRDDVALFGFSKFFKKNAEEEHEHAEKFIEYQIKRGGRVQFHNIAKPEKSEWSNGLEALQAALELEKHVNQSLLALHQLASNHNDAHLSDFIEEEFLDEQVEAIKKLSDYITNLKRAGDGLGEYLFDKHTLGSA